MPHDPQFVVVFSAVQTPPQHPWPAPQAVPHVPQFEVVFSAVQTPLQQPWPAAQAFPHVPQFAVVLSALQTPPQQPSPAAHVVPHDPQFEVVSSGVQTPLQQPWPGAQETHAPPAVPHADGEFCLQTPLSQHPFGHVAAVQVFTHMPLTQAWPFAHWTPHAPQFVTVSRGVQTPLQQP